MWRLIIDMHQYVYGSPVSELSALAIILGGLLIVLPVSVRVLTCCIDRIRPFWLAWIALFIAALGTLAFIGSSDLRNSLLPLGIVAQDSDSSVRWYCGAFVQFTLAIYLLKVFPGASKR